MDLLSHTGEKCLTHEMCQPYSALSSTVWHVKRMKALQVARAKGFKLLAQADVNTIAAEAVMGKSRDPRGRSLAKECCE
jgi:hypothetical protein